MFTVCILYIFQFHFNLALRYCNTLQAKKASSSGDVAVFLLNHSLCLPSSYQPLHNAAQQSVKKKQANKQTKKSYQQTSLKADLQWNRHT